MGGRLQGVAGRECVIRWLLLPICCYVPALIDLLACSGDGAAVLQGAAAQALAMPGRHEHTLPSTNPPAQQRCPLSLCLHC